MIESNKIGPGISISHQICSIKSLNENLLSVISFTNGWLACKQMLGFAYINMSVSFSLSSILEEFLLNFSSSFLKHLALVLLLLVNILLINTLNFHVIVLFSWLHRSLLLLLGKSLNCSCRVQSFFVELLFQCLDIYLFLRQHSIVAQLTADSSVINRVSYLFQNLVLVFLGPIQQLLLWHHIVLLLLF